ncbi:MAG TPA: hypothetical protein VF701_19125, partial [Thermoanaerobaculia bacterium]
AHPLGVTLGLMHAKIRPVSQSRRAKRFGVRRPQTPLSQSEHPPEDRASDPVRARRRSLDGYAF